MTDFDGSVVTHWSTVPARADAAAGRLAPGVSTILCTYERPDSAMRFLVSLAGQTRRPDEVLVIDASRSDTTEQLLGSQNLPLRLTYWRVTGRLRGLTRQRNFGLKHVAHDLVAFFDDDVVLETDCLEELERAHRRFVDVAGIGCFVEPCGEPTRLWRLRRALRIVPHLQAGRYTESGMSIPWQFRTPGTQLVDGDWLPGCAMMVKTDLGSRLLFDEELTGYAQGEDLDFSLRLRRHGRVALLETARCQHLHEPAGRPDAFKLGEMEIVNRHRIWRRQHSPPSLRARWWFMYAWSLDTVLLIRGVLNVRRTADVTRRLAGRAVGAARVVMRSSPTRSEAA